MFLIISVWPQGMWRKLFLCTKASVTFNVPLMMTQWPSPHVARYKTGRNTQAQAGTFESVLNHFTYIICDGTRNMTLNERYETNDFKTHSQGVVRGLGNLKIKRGPKRHCTQCTCWLLFFFVEAVLCCSILFSALSCLFQAMV